MTPDEAMAELARLFSGPPERRGKCTWQHRRYDLVRLPDGTVGFALNEFHAMFERLFDETVDEIFGPKKDDGP